MPIAPASCGVNPISSAIRSARNIPTCAAAPKSNDFGFAISGPKSVIAPIPRKINGGKITHSTPL